MKASVTKSYGELPIILIAPHGPDDINTAEIVEMVSEDMNIYSLINWGWQKSKKYDDLNYIGDCNSIKHLSEDVLEQEFFNPYLELVEDCLTDHNEAHIFIIHGCGNYIKKKTKEETEVIVGYGSGNKRSSASKKLKNMLFTSLSLANVKFAGGHKNGNFAGRSSNNLNQYFRKHTYNPSVNSFQLEFTRDFRDNAKAASFDLSTILKIYYQCLIQDKYSDHYDPVMV